MCGIVGVAREAKAAEFLLNGLHQLEYRGYDSAGLAVHDSDGIHRARVLGRVAKLEDTPEAKHTAGTGIAHTRWATHGAPSVGNAHPHMAGDDIALVHNGIIENYAQLRDELLAEGCSFQSQTDTEVVVQLLAYFMRTHDDLESALQATVKRLEGAYALAVLSTDQPGDILAVRKGSPMLVGKLDDGYALASDISALLKYTRTVCFPEEGDIVRINRDRLVITRGSTAIEPQWQESQLNAEAASKGEYAHFMLKEIFEQPCALRNTMESRLGSDHILEAAFGTDANSALSETGNVHIVACGTSYHAGLVASYWLERFANIPCRVEIGSEYRYRHPAVPANTLFVSLSQSGETADTIAALRMAKELGYVATLAICNVPESTLVRESDFALMTHAGPEIGVASTKAFTTQLAALLMLTATLTRFAKGNEAEMVAQLKQTPSLFEQTLAIDAQVQKAAELFDDVNHAIFLGRGPMYPIAMEGALKLKEISYIHVHAYAAGELKHGPLALVDEKTPVVVVAPNNELLDKLMANMEEVRARGGRMLVFATADAKLHIGEMDTLIVLPEIPMFAEPLVFTLPLQLLSYYVALRRGLDIDKPRNLAKSVTVE